MENSWFGIVGIVEWLTEAKKFIIAQTEQK